MMNLTTSPNCTLCDFNSIRNTLTNHVGVSISQKFMEQNLHAKLWAFTSNVLQHVCCLTMIQGTLTEGSYGYQLVLLLKSG